MSAKGKSESYWTGEPCREPLSINGNQSVRLVNNKQHKTNEKKLKHIKFMLYDLILLYYNFSWFLFILRWIFFHTKNLFKFYYEFYVTWKFLVKFFFCEELLICHGYLKLTSSVTVEVMKLCSERKIWWGDTRNCNFWWFWSEFFK